MDSLNRKAFIVFFLLLVLDFIVRISLSKEAIDPKGLEHLSFDPTQVLTVEIASGKERVTIARTSRGLERVGIVLREEGGKESGPLPPSKAREVEAFLQRICTLVRESIDGAPGNEDTTYGLDPEHSVGVRLQYKINGKEERSFAVRFGSVLPLNVMYVYASFDDKPGLFKVLKTYKESTMTLLHSLIQ